MMRREKQQNIVVRFIFSPQVFFLIVIIIFVALAFPISKNISKKYKIDEEILELEKEIQVLEDSNGDFKKMIKYLESDYFVEEQARLNMGLKEEGEGVIVIEQNILGAGIGGRNDLDMNVKRRDLNASSWWSYFFGERN